MKQNKRLYVNILWLIVGSILIGLSFAGIVDEYWNGMGMAFAIVGAINLLRIHRLNKVQLLQSDYPILSLYQS